MLETGLREPAETTLILTRLNDTVAQPHCKEHSVVLKKDVFADDLEPDNERLVRHVTVQSHCKADIQQK